ncbi:GNAT family N-acetyltransferase [Methanospirillum sp. J.3.6.1-F.2.7.3]|uniref:GNAT family N-acetyltransferase n=1 Tax=Methanospirillum purgamenti TaxID=2834276 RepID=A0A8E7B4R1_9EURY|nr:MULTISPECIES: GNAT family N-acetyltransferase [Methanospirillum]MDX8550212.1 GNAT family N-acetyltransferase [Methanospirillum hungatei]QVV90396.1 GNAT family N-acetyltransferase [Methanospirillum sp. J.3.6.1-F.2.7.3]
MNESTDLTLRALTPNENIPYSLLLLADETKEAIDTYIHQSVIYVLEHEGEMIAVCAVARISDSAMEIKNIAVREDWQNKGVGYRFLLDIIHKVQEQGCSELIIATADCGHKQLYLYQKAGFQPDRVIPDYFIQNYPEPIFENGIQLKDQVILKMIL